MQNRLIYVSVFLSHLRNFPREDTFVHIICTKPDFPTISYAEYKHIIWRIEDNFLAIKKSGVACHLLLTIYWILVCIWGNFPKFLDISNSCNCYYALARSVAPH